MTVSKQTGTTITLILAVLFGCAGIFTCISTLISLRDRMIVLQAGVVRPALLPLTGQLAALGAGLCTALGFIALPIVFYIVLVAGRKDEPAAKPAPEQ